MELPNLVSKLYDLAESKIEVWPCHTNRASMLGSDCVRQIVYWRTRWEEAELHDVHLQLIFEEGKVQEKALMRDLEDAGIEVIEQQVTLSWPEYKITGHVDGVLNIDGVAVPLEIKSMSDHIWQSVAWDGPREYDWPEVREAFKKRFWLRKYPAQLQIYMLCKDTESAIMLCKNKSTGAVAQINMRLDYEYAERLLQRAERINSHIMRGTMPERIPWDEDVCGNCAFVNLCCPDQAAGPPIAFVEDIKALERLEERAETEKAHKTFASADKWIKSWVHERYPDTQRITVGAFLLEKKLTEGGRRQTKITKLSSSAIKPAT